MYHTNPAINDTILSIINDGEGTQCGMTYKQRCAAAEYGLLEFRVACRVYSDWRKRHEARGLTRQEIIEAAEYLQHYYRQHMKEGA